MNYDIPPKVESGATTPKPETSKAETGESFENKFNKKRILDITTQLEGIGYHFEEKEISIETVKYVVSEIKVELYGMSETLGDDNLRYARKELEGALSDITSGDDDEKIAQRIKNAVNLLKQIK